jgi:hypothetical protein
MKRHEIARCCLLNRQAHWEFSRDLDALRCQERQPQQKLLGAKLVVAVNRISRWWLACARRQWLNQVAWDAARMHAFPHRTETNYAPWRRHFRGGIDGIKRILATTRYLVHSDADVACPECRTSPVCVALWTQVGEKMARSTPHLHIGCVACMISSPHFSHDDIVCMKVFSASMRRKAVWHLHCVRE